MVMLGFPGPSIFEERDYAAMIVLDAITSGYSYPGGWLHTELRGEGLVYGVHAFQLTGPAPGFFTVMAQTTPEKLSEVIARIQINMERARAGQITPEEFETSKQMVTALHAQENTTIAEQARQAALDELYGLGYAYDQKYDERIQAVTLEDVARVAKDYLSRKSVLVSTSP
jgi:zinc protease